MKDNYLTKKYFLFIVFLFLTGIHGNAQADYSVNSIPHQVYVGSVPVEFTYDDLNSNVITLPFYFDFYGNSYNQLLVSTNGYLDFRTELANGGSPWSFNTSIPNVNFPVKNSILACYHDTYNQVGAGSITYSLVGAAPYRKAVFVFHNQPQFQCNLAAISTFQVVLYETLNVIDVQIVERQVCPGWNGGRAVIGIINALGTDAVSPPGRNTGNWTAQEEGWRFRGPEATINVYNYTKCDDDSDGFVSFDLDFVENELVGDFVFYTTLSDAELGQNPIAVSAFTNTSAYFQKIYAKMSGVITEVVLRVVDCASDYDLDSVATADEDLNNDGNLANDDTDGDGIPNFIDNDDDGDMILTNFEYVFPSARNGQQSSQNALDTDGDGIPNYLDNDDDGDGVLTINEDYDGDNDPSNDDTNFNGIPDYLEQAVALGIRENVLDNLISIYPNPASDYFSVLNKGVDIVSHIAVFSLNGSLVKEVKVVESGKSISVSDLQAGVYFVRLTTESQTVNCKLIKK